MRHCEAALGGSTNEGGREEALKGDSVQEEVDAEAIRLLYKDSNAKETPVNACKEVM